jgi:glycosyltransferase involved in cell wall biosynthesis
MAYSYAARRILATGREFGAKLILGQIDGGYAEEQLMCQLHAHKGMAYRSAPDDYWDNWRGECALADAIVVNSEWSRSLLCSAGIDERKIIIIPLLYDVMPLAGSSMRTDPRAFTKDRPMRLLFLGQLTVRKGFLEAIEAAQILKNAPVHFSFVGGDFEGLAAMAPRLQNVTYHGHLPRSEVRVAYEKSDLFLFPTHSDGFGLTQLEALSAGLPVIASRHCGRVVEHGRTGCVLDRVSGEAIASAVEHFLKNPYLIGEMSNLARTSAATLSSKAETKFLEVVQGMTTEQGRS